MKPSEVAERIAREIIKKRRERLNAHIEELASSSSIIEKEKLRFRAIEAIDKGII